VSDYITPCADPANDPDDWFIERDGRQYPDESLDLDEQKAALVRRRHARDKCHVECYFRTQCLTIALTKPEPPHGTWGGYYPEELRQVRSLRDERARRAPVTEEA
jgi:hypothetical protein